jgi:outer membrane cobalamin receptor
MKKDLMVRYLFAFLLMFLSFQLNAGNIVGYVYHLNQQGEKTPLQNANVYFSDLSVGTTTDDAGKFTIERKTKDDVFLIAAFAGFKADTVLINNSEFNEIEFVLKDATILKSVTVTGTNIYNVLNKNAHIKTEVINKTGLMKMACCNLSESFENSATVTVGFSDAVSGAKQVQLLGLSGNYTQLMAENVPTLRGLATSFGWSFTPGSWLESIQLSKGASSVVNGYEAISGQINLEFKKPNNTEPLFINLFADEFGCYEANITAATQVSDNLWTALLLSGTLDNKPHDYNGDNFLDMPQRQFVNAYNRWLYISPNGLQSRTGIKFLYENRIGGHDPFHSNSVSAGAHYTTDIQNRNFTIENKTGFSVGSKEGQSVGIISSFTHHEQNSVFGLRTFAGNQTSFYTNLLFTSHIGTGNSHKYTVGGSLILDNFKTNYLDSIIFNQTPFTELNRREIAPGIFGEYTFSPTDKFALIAGLRTDYNSKYGWLFTPRANVKYNLTNNLIFRASIGKGYRVPNAISDNIGILASSRKLYVENIATLDIEKAWNYGGNFTFYVPIWDEKKLTLSLDYFHTEFQNQAVIDTERDNNSVYFYNLNGRSYADAWQADVSVTPFTRFDVFAAFRYNNTQITYSDGTENYQVEKPLTSRFRGLINLSYATKFRKWVFDFTTQVNGPTRIPWLNGYNSELKESPVFPILFAQITKNTKWFDVYVGAENILGYKQNNPIINAENPFDQGFESSFVWGPIVGRKLYAGVRIRIGK